MRWSSDGCRFLCIWTALMAAQVAFPNVSWATRLARPAQELYAAADVVVVGRITGIKVQAERSRMNSGFGNYDWVIYCTVQIDAQEKGRTVSPGSEIIVQCQRPRYIKSFDCFSCGYHRPIPEVGQSVRAYLRQAGGQYSALDPNGFMPSGSQELVQSAAVQQLPRGRYTYLMPIEELLIMMILATVIWGITSGVRYWTSRLHKDQQHSRRHSLTFDTTWVFAVVAFVAIGLGGQRWDPSFVGWASLVLMLVLVGCAFRTPQTALGRSVCWGVGLTFLSAIVAAVAGEML